MFHISRCGIPCPNKMGGGISWTQISVKTSLSSSLSKELYIIPLDPKKPGKNEGFNIFNNSNHSKYESYKLWTTKHEGNVGSHIMLGYTFPGKQRNTRKTKTSRLRSFPMVLRLHVSPRSIAVKSQRKIQMDGNFLRSPQGWTILKGPLWIQGSAARNAPIRVQFGGVKYLLRRYLDP